MRMPNFLRRLPQWLRQYRVGVLVLGLVVLAMAPRLFGGRVASVQTAQTAQTATHGHSLASAVTPAHQLQGQVDQMRRDVKDQLKTMSEMQQHTASLERALREAQQARERDRTEALALATRQQQQFEETLKQARASKAREAGTPMPAPRPVVSQSRLVETTPPPSLRDMFELRTLRPEKRSTRPIPSGVTQDDTAYLPATSIAPGRILTGVIANSRGYGNAPGAEGDTPVMLMLTGPYRPPVLLQGPERAPLETGVDLRGCRLFGWARADLGAGRVYVTVHLQACVLPDKSAYEAPVKGYVVDSDNTLGVVGRLETRDSAMIAKAALAGVVQEAATLFSLAKSQLVVSNTAGGYVQPFTGVQSSIQQISAYYLEQARQLTPVLWIEANQAIRIVLQEGLYLEGYPVVALLGGH